MLKNPIIAIVAFVVIGLVIAAASIQTIGLTAAISIPEPLADGFRAWNIQAPGVLAWDTVVVYGLGIGLFSFVALTAAYRFLFPATVTSFAAFIAGVLLMAHAIVPMISGMPASLFNARPWSSYGFEIAVIIAALTAFLTAKRFGYSGSSQKP